MDQEQLCEHSWCQDFKLKLENAIYLVIFDQDGTTIFAALNPVVLKEPFDEVLWSKIGDEKVVEPRDVDAGLSARTMEVRDASWRKIEVRSLAPSHSSSGEIEAQDAGHSSRPLEHIVQNMIAEGTSPWYLLTKELLEAVRARRQRARRSIRRRRGQEFETLYWLPPLDLSPIFPSDELLNYQP
ncbi:hypothetical protein MMC16_000413 [Acarospora aff. strigata]|nr:hypothetical protein [Acarospora aff. strigata]